MPVKKAHKRLGELVLRTSNVNALMKFYINVIGLELYASFGNNRFLKVGNDLEGHPQLLVIFDNTKSYSGPKNMKKGISESRKGTLHHFAFTLEKNDFEMEKLKLKELGVELKSAVYEAFGWNSIHFHDPDGNSIEFVCYNPQDLNLEKNREVRKDY